MMMKCKLLFLLLLGPGLAFAQRNANGYVYNDANGNGHKEAGEKGIAGVPVSNGSQVVLTDARGRYTLPVTDNTILFVIKPTGYRVPVSSINQPLFFYVHEPNGSPTTLKYKGVAPTGPLPKSVDFALTPEHEPDQFKALVFGDPQPASAQELGYFDHDIVGELKGVKNVAFGLTLGDLVQEDLNSEKDYHASVGKIGIPWYNVMGNHDLNTDAPDDSLSHETFVANYGPDTYSFNYGKMHVIVVNDNRFPMASAGRKKGFLRGGFRADQQAFIKNDLQYVDTARLVVITFHIPMNTATDRDDLNNTFRKADQQWLFGVLQKYPHVLEMSAHTHCLDQNFYDAASGWNGKEPFHELVGGATCGQWNSGIVDKEGFLEGMMADGTPRGYIYLNVNGNQYTADYKVAEQSPDFQIRLYHRKVLTPIFWDAHGFIWANFFMGYKGSKVECSIDGGPWKSMEYTVADDPFYISKLYKWDESDTLFKGRRPSEPGQGSRHLWKVPLPNKNGPGTHRISVRATDLYGRTFVAGSSYQIEEAKQ
jgi:hypothetical protein